MSVLDRKSFIYFGDIKLVLISEISVQMESACGFMVLLQAKWFFSANKLFLFAVCKITGK